MFCNKCGKDINDEAAICIHCGCSVNTSNKSKKVAPVDKTKKFCSKCGGEMHDEADVCVHCGCSVTKNNTSSNILDTGGEKSGMIALILCFFFGYLGVHRFYSGHILFGILQLVTGGGCLIWAIVDLIIILMGKYTDSEGNPMTLK